MLLIGGIGALITGCATSQSSAKVSEAQARQTALAEVPDGTIRESELEHEHGKLVWSFDIARPGTDDLTEILVDANTGAIVATEMESPEQQEEEAEEEAGERVSLEDLTPPARATAERLVAGGGVDKIDKEVERGKEVYDVEASVGGRHVEFLIAADTGELLGREDPIEFSELPEAVRAAAEQFFGATTGLTVMKGVEYGETSYEIEGRQSGRRVEVSFDPAGKRVE